MNLEAMHPQWRSWLKKKKTQIKTCLEHKTGFKQMDYFFFFHLVTWITLSPTRLLCVEHLAENGLLVCGPNSNTNIQQKKNLAQKVTNFELKHGDWRVTKFAYPHLSQREANSPDRIDQPLFHSPDVEVDPHCAFMHTFVDSIVDQTVNQQNKGRAFWREPNSNQIRPKQRMHNRRCEMWS